LPLTAEWIFYVVTELWGCGMQLKIYTDAVYYLRLAIQGELERQQRHPFGEPCLVDGIRRYERKRMTSALQTAPADGVWTGPDDWRRILATADHKLLRDRNDSHDRPGLWEWMQNEFYQTLDRLHTAVHEAGHAVIALALGYPIAYATIEADENSAGHVIYVDIHDVVLEWEKQGLWHRSPQSAYRARIISVMAGAEAENELCGKCDGGDGDDRLCLRRGMLARRRSDSG
jgi:hypothetical protein